MKFNNGKHFINVETVAELKAALTQLPDDLEIKQGFSETVDVVVLHNPNDEYHLAFEDGHTN